MTLNAERTEAAERPKGNERDIHIVNPYDVGQSPDLAPDLSRVLNNRGGSSDSSRAVLAPAEPRPNSQPYSKIVDSRIKRAFDVIIATAALIVFLPLLLLVALIIRLESPGPAIFRQRRGGLAGRQFEIYKFRTMYETTGDNAPNPMSHDRARVTRFGRFLRRSSIDELPQLINVLVGDMSIVGPRPHALCHDEYYAGHVAGYLSRMVVKPGITGLAQVSGCRGEVTSHHEMIARIDLDLKYINPHSPDDFETLTPKSAK